MRDTTRSETRLFVGLALLAVVLISRGSQATHGDAPYHLAISASIVHDADLDLDNQFAADGSYVFRRDLTTGFARAGRDGHRYPSEGIGLGVVLAPVFAAAEGVASILPASFLDAVRWNRERCTRDLISVVLGLWFAWTAVLAFRIDGAVRPAGRRRLLAVVLAFVTLPLFGASILALTEVPAAWLTLWFVWRQLRPNRAGAGVRLADIWPLAVLPWLHWRYLVIAIAGVVWLATRRARGARRQAPAALALKVATPVLASCALLVAANWWMFGSLLPPAGVAAPPSSPIWRTLGGVIGQALNPDFGLLAVAPLWLVALAGASRLRAAARDYRRFALTVAGGLAVVAAATASWREPGPAALAVAPSLPLLVPFVAEGLDAVRGAGRWFVVATAAWALLVTGLTIDRPARSWTEPGTGVARLPLAGVEWVAAFRSPRRRLERAGVTVDDATFVERASAGDVEAARLFLGAGESPDVALQAAARAGQMAVVDVLLAAYDVPDATWARARLSAELEGHSDVAERLESAGADWDATDTLGRTALMGAAETGNAAELDALLARGADVNHAGRTGRTALFLAIERGRSAIVSRLIAAGAGVDTRDHDGWTPLLSAARAGDVAIVRVLLDAGADANATSRLGWTALMIAAQDGRPDVARALVAAGADVNVTTRAGLNALVRAVQEQHGDVVQVLIAAGADPTISAGGLDARGWARVGGHPELFDAGGRGGAPPDTDGSRNSGPGAGR
ncbi:MAG: ankyrin repeat domain-containing protein [Vicinamibacterales bacterium]